jgi:diamine N-acetyltransferase
MQIKLILATSNDFLVIANLAETIWHKHYIPIIGKEQVLFMLDKMYSENSLHEQMHEKGQRFYLIQNSTDNSNIGFISISEDKPESFWIHKFYVLDTQQGKGVGAKVFELILLEMKDASSIRLTVNRQNFKSINFYFKLGFCIEEVADFDIGNGYFMNDFVMRWKRA